MAPSGLANSPEGFRKMQVIPEKMPDLFRFRMRVHFDILALQN
jgi:hypothetical protein